MNRLRECRENKHLSQKEVAFEVGVRPSTVSQWETGKKRPSRDKIALLAVLFDVASDYLLGISQDEEMPSLSNLALRETILIRDFRQLSDENKRTIEKQISFLIDDQEREKEQKPHVG